MIFDFARAGAGCKRIKDVSYKTLRLSLVNQDRIVQRVSAKFDFMKAREANSVLLFLPTIWWLDALKRREEITRENTLDQKKKKLGLNFNPGLALIEQT